MEDAILATGRSGSIGQFTAPYAVALTTRLETTVQARVKELSAMGKGSYTFLHLAGLTSVKECEADPGRAMELNVEGSLRWLKAAAETGSRHFVYVSTSHVFRAREDDRPCKIDDATDAVSAYGRSKAQAEIELLKLAPTLGIRVTIARVFSVISEKMRPGFLYPELVRRAKERNVSPLPGYLNVRDFIDAEVAAAELAAIGRSEGGPPLRHVCSGVPRSVRSLAEDVFIARGYTLDQLTPMFPALQDRPNYLYSVPNLRK